jgi:hypothetical protein
MTAPQPSTGYSPVGTCGPPMPALLTATSSRPNPSTAARTISSQALGSVTSTTCARASSPMASATRRAGSALTSVTSTFAPRRASSVAHASPIPDPAPVTTATLPAKSSARSRVSIVSSSRRSALCRHSSALGRALHWPYPTQTTREASTPKTAESTATWAATQPERPPGAAAARPGGGRDRTLRACRARPRGARRRAPRRTTPPGRQRSCAGRTRRRAADASHGPAGSQPEDDDVDRRGPPKPGGRGQRTCHPSARQVAER